MTKHGDQNLDQGDTVWYFKIIELEIQRANHTRGQIIPTEEKQ